MAVSDGKFLRGKVAHLTYRVVNGRQVVSGRSEKKTFAKTIPSKKSANVFGQTSCLASYIREATCWLCENSNDGGMVNRMTKETGYALRAALHPNKKDYQFKQNSFNRLEGFNFNIRSPFENYLLARPLVDYSIANRVRVCLPEMNLGEEMIFPPHSIKCKVLITCMQLDLQYGHSSNLQLKEFVIEKSSSTAVTKPKFATFRAEPGCLCIIGVSLQYYQKLYLMETIMNSKLFNPATILSAYITDGIVNEFAIANWAEMLNKKGRRLLLAPPAPAQFLLGSPNDTAV